MRQVQTGETYPGKDKLKWYVLHVRSKHEFIANAELQKKGIRTFLPTVKKWRQWKDRRKLVEFPLFPGYLFVNIALNSTDHLKVLKTRGAVRFLSEGPGSPAPVSPEEVSSLKLLVESGEELDIYPHLREGTKVRVTRGLFRGAEGVLDKKEAHCTFIVNIILLGRSVGARVLADDIERV